MIIQDTTMLHDLAYSGKLEWLETNGLGGYASGTISGINTRRYHGLLIASLHPPAERKVVVSSLDDTIVVNATRFELSTHQYPETVYPQGYLYLQAFHRQVFPEFYYQAGGVLLKKTIAAVHGENTTLVLYEVLEAPSKFTLELKPFYACRNIHHATQATDLMGEPYVFDKHIFRTMNYQGSPELFISVPKSKFTCSKHWYYNFEMPEEMHRGLEFKEDLYSHGTFMVQLQKGSKLGIIISTEDPAGRDAFKLFRAEKKRREGLMKPFSWNDALENLALAADQFVVRRGTSNSIIAGYHWFTDKGRDAMISLTGLCLVTHRYQEAKNVLQTFGDHISEGLIPYRFPDNNGAPEYKSIDASLWYFYALYKYYTYTSDKAFIQSIVPLLNDIIECYFRGTRYDIHIDPEDQLLCGHEKGVALTWMDAKAGDWVVTERKGKPVEGNALWYNALCIMERFMILMNREGDAAFYKMKAEEVLENFNTKFWNARKNCLYDYIDGDYKSEHIRPNQVFAISLPFPLVTHERARSVFEVVRNDLLTPKGLKSLSPDHPEYRPVYEGGVWSRDAAYHQGTVWSFLLGPYIDALMFISDGEAKLEARMLLQNFFTHLGEAGIGSVSEIFDGDPPHHPRGSIAHATSVGEILRVAIEYDLFSDPGVQKKKNEAPQYNHVLGS